MFSRNRICRTCEEKKPLSAYRKDSKGRDGISVTCSACKNAKRKKHNTIVSNAPEKVLSRHTPHAPIKPLSVEQEAATTHQKTTIKPVSTGTIEDTLKKISEKYDSHYVISVSKDGKRLLHVQSNPARIYKGNSVEELLQMAIVA